MKKKAEHKDATEDERRRFRLALRAISDLRKAEERREEAKTSEHYEKEYHKNKWRFAKKKQERDVLQERKEAISKYLNLFLSI